MTDSPAAVLASFVRLSTLADGTVRAIIDVEPNNRSAAFALFDEPGAALALARITNEAAIAHDQRNRVPVDDPLPEHKAPLPLVARVGMTCKEESFRRFLSSFDAGGLATASQGDARDPVRRYVHAYCGVDSRRDIVPGTQAAERWNTLSAEYEQWQRAA